MSHSVRKVDQSLKKLTFPKGVSGGRDFSSVNPQQLVQREESIRGPHPLDCIRAGIVPYFYVIVQFHWPTLNFGRNCKS